MKQISNLGNPEDKKSIRFEIKRAKKDMQFEVFTNDRM